MINQALIPSRIQTARRMQRLSMDKLVERMGTHSVSKMSISKIERGVLQPSLATLQSIADACCVPLAYFFKPQIQLTPFAYRFDKDMPVKKVEQITAQVTDAVSRFMECESFEPHPVRFANPLRIKTLRGYSDAEEAALQLRRKLYLGTQPIFSVYELVESLGAHVIEMDIDYRLVYGISTTVIDQNSHETKDSKARELKLIVINTHGNPSPERKRFTTLHELAHLLFRFAPHTAEEHAAYVASLPPHPFATEVKQPTVERLCHYFASAMLMPPDIAHRRIGHIRTSLAMDELIASSDLYGISVSALVHRLHDLRIIDDALYHYTFETQLRGDKHVSLSHFPILEKADRWKTMQMRIECESEYADNDE